MHKCIYHNKAFKNITIAVLYHFITIFNEEEVVKYEAINELFTINSLNLK